MITKLAVIVTGSRQYSKSQTVIGALETHQPNLVIQGGATGADYLGLLWAKSRGIPYETFAANWQAHGRAAGPIRNQEMTKRGMTLREDGWRVVVLAFPGSAGTKSMIRCAEAAGLEVVHQS